MTEDGSQVEGRLHTGSWENIALGEATHSSAAVCVNQKTYWLQREMEQGLTTTLSVLVLISSSRVCLVPVEGPNLSMKTSSADMDASRSGY